MLDFGVFDHVDFNHRSLGDFYEERLQLVEKLDLAGFYGYHVAEHHLTPLGMASSPSVYLAAVAQRTRRLRFGPLVYTLPLYHPIRLAEEICMLDQMSRGRLEIGVGRGISPIEASLYGAPANVADSRQMHLETLEIIKRAFEGNVTFEGKFRSVANVDMQLRPFQIPHPPLWMGVATEESAETAAQGGYSFIATSPATEVRKFNRRYLDARKSISGEKTADPKRGLGLYIVVADTDREAEEMAARAYRVWHRNFNYLYERHGRTPVKGERASEFSEVQRETRAIAGSAKTVTEFLQRRLDESESNYLVGQFIFGDLTYAEAARSIELFSDAVMPAFKSPAAR